MNQINDYLQTNVGNVTSDVTSNVINTLLQWVLIPSLVFIVIFLAIYIVRAVHRHKVDSAIFEIRDMLREMHPTSPAPTNSKDTSEPQ